MRLTYLVMDYTFSGGMQSPICSDSAPELETMPALPSLKSDHLTLATAAFGQRWLPVAVVAVVAAPPEPA